MKTFARLMGCVVLASAFLKPVWASAEGSFTFKGGGRDPFSFLKMTSDTPPPLKPPDAPNLDYLASFVARAEQALRDEQPRQAILLSEEGLKHFTGIPNLESQPLARECHDQLLRVQLAAKRLHLRREAETAFGALNLRLSGVVASERDSRAVINGKIYQRGELLETADKSITVQLIKIQKNQVVVRFRGLDIALSTAGPG